MKRNGFTLIELLAVIVVLAIIALIATPIVLNIINNAKDSANKISVELYCSAVKNAIVIKNLETEVPVGTYTTLDSHKYNINNEELKIDYEGNDVNCTLEIEENGNIKLTNCKVNNVSVDYGCNNGEVVEVDEEDDSSVANKVYEDGDYVYFDVKTGKKCSNYHIDNSKTGYNGEVEDNTRKTTDNQTSCLKFYAFNDSSESSTVDMILDHNTTVTVTWNSSGDSSDGPDEVLTKLKSDTENWNGVVAPDNYTNAHYNYTVDYSLYGNKARLITANEIAKITGADELINWDEVDTSADAYLLDSKDQDISKLYKELGTSEYAWLFDYTGYGYFDEELDKDVNYLCTKFGCKVGDLSTYGYWTSSANSFNTEYAWIVCGGGLVAYGSVDYSGDAGIRPVITVLKSSLK